MFSTSGKAATMRPSLPWAATLRSTASSTIMSRSTVSSAVTLRLTASCLSSSPDDMLRSTVLAILSSSVVMPKLAILGECRSNVT